LLHSVRDGRPLVAANAVRTRRIGYAVIAAEIARSMAIYAGSRNAMRDFAIQGVTLHSRPSLDVSAIVAGLIILVIAQVFRKGARLEEEQSLTVSPPTTRFAGSFSASRATSSNGAPTTRADDGAAAAPMPVGRPLR
jgi:Protein of unknown function (DUF2975)